MARFLTQGQNKETVKIGLILALGLLTVGFSIFGVAPGHLSVDEIAYHLMVRSLSASGGFEILNGYQDFASSAFVLPVTVVQSGQLVSQYPPFHSLLALPFYELAGYQGLFLMNALAFCGVVWVCYLLAQRTFSDRSLSLTGCLILILATFSWDYAQAAWPHALATLFVAVSAYFALRAFQAPERRTATAWAAAAGVVVGFGVGVRVDVIFVLPALIIPLLLARPPRSWPAVAVGLATLPGLVSLALVNQIKFGVANPFSYGGTSGSGISVSSYVPVVAIGVAVTAGLWLLTRPRLPTFWRDHRWTTAIGLCAAVGALLLVPEIRISAARLAGGLYQLVVDLRVRDLGIAEGGLSRGPGGGMVYFGGLKKSLLQSCPYLASLAIPIYALFRTRALTLPLVMLLFVPVTYIGAYGYFAWHGGMGLNLRYLLPVLPFTSILTAFALRDLARKAAGGRLGFRLGTASSILLLGGLFAVAPLFVLPVARAETVLLTGPLVLAGVVFALVVGTLVVRLPARTMVAQFAVAGLIVSLAWAGMIAFTYDVPRSFAKRAIGVQVSAQVAPLIEPRSLLVVEHISKFTGLFERGDIRIAEPLRDDFLTFRPLVEAHFRAGFSVYAWFPDNVWRDMRARGLLRSIVVTPMAKVAGRALIRLTPQVSQTGAAR